MGRARAFSLPRYIRVQVGWVSSTISDQLVLWAIRGVKGLYIFLPARGEGGPWIGSRGVFPDLYQSTIWFGVASWRRSGTSVRSSTGDSIEGKKVSISRCCVTVVAGAGGADQGLNEDDLGRLEEEANVGWGDSTSRI